MYVRMQQKNMPCMYVCMHAGMYVGMMVCMSVENASTDPYTIRPYRFSIGAYAAGLPSNRQNPMHRKCRFMYRPLYIGACHFAIDPNE